MSRLDDAIADYTFPHGDAYADVRAELAELRAKAALWDAHQRRMGEDLDDTAFEIDNLCDAVLDHEHCAHFGWGTKTGPHGYGEVPASLHDLASWARKALGVLVETIEAQRAENVELRSRAALLDAPELHDFTAAVVREAAHQRSRWGTEHDAGKTAADWFWLVGYLAGKALHAAIACNRDKALHHTISTAAALANWHAALLGADTRMRPGIEPPEGT